MTRDEREGGEGGKRSGGERTMDEGGRRWRGGRKN
jgi:hypothetical protein